MPFFIHYDDVEYGLRNLDNNQIFINGICVWHPAPIGKNPPWITYYDIRNKLITMFSHELCKKDFKRSLTKITKAFILRTICYDYSEASLMLDAIRDFIEGPEAFIKTEPLLLHRELLKKKNIYVSPDKIRVDEKAIIKKRYSNFKIAVLVQTICNLLPAKKDICAINTYYFYIPHRAKKVYYYNEKIREGLVCERNQKAFFRLLFSFLYLQCKLKHNYKKLLSNWQGAKATLNSLPFWENYLGLKDKE